MKTQNKNVYLQNTKKFKIIVYSEILNENVSVIANVKNISTFDWTTVKLHWEQATTCSDRRSLASNVVYATLGLGVNNAYKLKKLH